MQHLLIKKLQIDKKDLKDENKSFPLMSKDKHYEQFLIYPSRNILYIENTIFSF